MYKIYVLLSLFIVFTATASAQQPIVGQPCGAAGVSSIATSGQAVQCQGSPLTWVATGGGGGGGGTVTSVGVSSTGSTVTVTGSPITNSGTINVDVLPINLASSGNGGVTGNLPITNLNGGAAATNTTFWRGDGTWAAPTSTGTINSALQFSLPFYSTAGTASTLSGSAPPTANGVYNWISNVVAGVAVQPTAALSGSLPRDITGTTATDTILFSDCSNWVNYFGSVAVATSLPTPTSLGNTNCLFHVMNNTSGAATAVTFTATTFNFKSTGTTTRVVAEGQACTFNADNANSLWVDDCHDLPLVAGSGITITRGQFGPTIVSTGSAGALSALTAATASNTIANGNNPQTWNWAQTTNTQSGMTFGETSAATGGTLTGLLSNQNEVTISTASASTATPLNVNQGSITGTVAFPALQVQSIWNNASLAGRGLLVSVTNTSSLAGSTPFIVQVGGSTKYSVDTGGNTTQPGTLNAAGEISLVSTGAQGQASNIGVIYQGGVDGGTATQGAGTFRGGDNTNTASSAAGGAANLRGGDETGSTANATTGGTLTVRGGNVTLSTSTTSTGGPVTITGGSCVSITSANTCAGQVKVNQPYFSTGTAAANDLACVTAANTIASCSGTTVGQFVGVIDSAVTNQVFITQLGVGGTHTFNATSATFTNGHFVCQSSAAANLVVDSATVCANGAGIGIYIGATGTQTAPLVFMRTY